jgi:hypothetical protein
MHEPVRLNFPRQGHSRRDTDIMSLARLLFRTGTLI